MSADRAVRGPAAPAASRELRERGSSHAPRRRRWRAALAPTASVLGTLVLLEVVVQSRLLPDSVLPPPSDIGGEMAASLADGIAARLMLSTLQGWAVGLGAAVVAGAALGLLLGSLPTVERLLSGVLEFVRPIPSIALIPLCVIVLGIGMETKYLLVFIGSLWPILIHTVLGTRSVDLVASDTCRTYGVPLAGRIRHLMLPSVAPQFLTGLRISSAIALIVAITVELIVGAPGLGNQVNVAQQAGDTAQMWAYIGLIGVLGMVINAVFMRMERRVLHWHDSQRLEAA
ncbi:binding-protein-dependent transport system inner membrane protein [Mycobacterium tuberculosis]|nr:binding-protein-dependent transport system inner membrane protein [Mycobacterium tuberculosis]